MGRVRTHESFVQKINDLAGNEYSVMSEYEGVTTHVEMQHNLCQTIYPVTPQAFYDGRRCPACNIKKRTKLKTKTHAQFVQEVFALVGNDYSVLGQYEKAKVHILFKHNSCGHEYEAIPAIFISGSRCPKCMAKLRGRWINKSKN